MGLPQAEKEAVATIARLEDEISKLETIPSLVSELEKKKKELSVVKKKFPQKDLHARDYAQYVGSVADVEEKAAMIENQMKDKLAKQKEAYAKLTPEAEEVKKKLKEDF